MIHSFLFFVEKKKIFCYQYRDNGRFDLLPYSDGAKAKNFTPEFWSEWQQNCCYCPDDSVDFAFLTDKSLILETPPEYKVLTPTKFCNLQHIKDIFCKETLDYPNVKIVYNEREEQVLGKRNLLNDELRTFYLTIPYPAPQGILEPDQDGDYCFGLHLKELQRERQEKIDKLHKKKLNNL